MGPGPCRSLQQRTDEMVDYYAAGGAAAWRGARTLPSGPRMIIARLVVWGSPRENPGQQPKNCEGGLVGCFGLDATELRSRCIELGGRKVSVCPVSPGELTCPRWCVSCCLYGCGLSEKPSHRWPLKGKR